MLAPSNACSLSRCVWTVDADKADATFESGVLTLHLPKVPEVRPKKIEVKAKGLIEGKGS